MKEKVKFLQETCYEIALFFLIFFSYLFDSLVIVVEREE